MLRDCDECGELVVLSDGERERCECGAWVYADDVYARGPADQELWEEDE